KKKKNEKHHILSLYNYFCDSGYLAQRLRLPYLSAYLDSVGSNFTHGANFTTAGSTIRPKNTSLHQGGFSPTSLNVRLHQYNDFQHGSQIFRVFEGLLPMGEDFSRVLYMFDIGQNDPSACYFLNMTMNQVRAYVLDVLDQFKIIIKDVYAHRGRSYWIHNMVPMGCLQYALNRLIRVDQVDKCGRATPFNE
ncbi:GDSL esterase/lipase At3g26430-like, partial [Cornus florida]|uniref:GDSL esterase/lipase At3g26430-like n=1 Tax=Cornus florida TaxID=4283 RepID=UPI00289F1476